MTVRHAGALLLLVAAAFVGLPGRSEAVGAYPVPPVLFAQISMPATSFLPSPQQGNCLARLQPNGAQVGATFLCYESSDSAPPPPPPPYEAPVYMTFIASLNPATGAVQGLPFPCTEIVPGLYAFRVDLSAQLDKAGGPAAGTITVTEDMTQPLDCADGTQSVGSLTLTPLLQSHDQDGDGCTDWEELGTAQQSGGLRDPFNVWDFFDVPTGPYPNLARDKVVTVGDIQAVVARFGSSGTPGNPLSPPPAAPAYHSAYDRGAVLGPDNWNQDAANGSITVQDIAAVSQYHFGHSCLAAP